MPAKKTTCVAAPFNPRDRRVTDFAPEGLVPETVNGTGVQAMYPESGLDDPKSSNLIVCMVATLWLRGEEDSC
jgi:hypothetical protein